MQTKQKKGVWRKEETVRCFDVDLLDGGLGDVSQH